MQTKHNIIKAIAVFTHKLSGTVTFTEDINKSNISIEINVKGLKPNSLHGIHIHEAGDLSDHCESMCAHFNPYNKQHGCPSMKERHVGDLGNIKANKKGEVNYVFSDNQIKLRGSKCNIIGRSVIIHEDEDDCGLGGYPDSLTTGHAGKRLDCAVIGYSKEMFS